MNFRYVKESKRERESKRVKEIEFECVRWIYRERLCEYVGEREKEKDLKAKKFECHHFRDPLSLSLSLSLSLTLRSSFKHKKTLKLIFDLSLSNCKSF